MAELQGDKLYRTRAEILAEMIAAIQEVIPDVWLGEDGQLYMLFQVEAGQIEGLFLANQLVRDDIFVATAGISALERHGDQWSFPMKAGVRAEGELLITGAGGTLIPLSAEFSTSSDVSDPLFFVITESGTIPNPGEPDTPTVADAAVAGNLTGLMTYGVTFVTDEGETALGSTSLGVSVTASRVAISDISVGGPGTIARRIYRSEDGGDFKLVTTLNDNSTTTYQDNIATGSLGAPPPEESTAERIRLAAEADTPGADWNVVPGTIIEVTDAPTGVDEVTNPAAFTGGIDPEDHEEFRQRLLQKIRVPETGSVSDLELWAEAVEGVEEATAFPNDDEGTPTNGHVTVRISGPDGTIPDAEVIAAVQTELESKDIANMTIHVATFTAVPTDVTVAITALPNFTEPELVPSVEQAIEDYINSVDVGGTIYISGIIDAVFGLPGIADVTVSVPAANQTSTALQKRTPGTITVT